MDAAGVIGLVRRVADVESAASLGELQTAAGDVERLVAWAESRRLRIAQRITEISSFPEKDLATATRRDLRDGLRVIERSELAATMPAFADGLADGAVAVEHIDIVGRALRDLEPGQRPLLAARAEVLLESAKQLSPGQFANVIRDEVRRLQADDGMDRYQRQQRATRLRTWTDRVTGMGHIAGEFDPLSFTKLSARLSDMVATLFAEAVPDTCPSDPIAKQDHLRALALCELAAGGGGRVGRPEFIVVVDTTTPTADGLPTVDWGLPVEVPWRVLCELAADADVHTVVVRNGVVLHAPGNLHLGRTTRLANRPQRRALRALYPTCAIDGCQIGFTHCDIHHVHWYELHGLTDFENLLPLCSRHHHAVHDDGWQLHLTKDRVLTVTMPDGRTMSTGPPKRRAA